MEEKTARLEERIARLEGIMEQVAQRLNHVETEIGNLRNKIDSNFKWTLGILITMWITIILTVLLK